MLRVWDAAWFSRFCCRDTAYWRCITTGVLESKQCPLPLTMWWVFWSTWKQASSAPQPFKKPLFFCHPLQLTRISLQSLQNILPLLGKTDWACAAEKPWVSLLTGRRRRRQGNLLLWWIFPHFLLFLFWAHWFRSCGLFSAWLSLCENCSFPKRDHLLVLIGGDSIPRFSPFRTKGIIFHLHSKWSTVSWGN